MLNYPMVSVLMTAYNREKYIADAIESVLASSYQNWELIIVDDGSKDRTVEIAKSYEIKDKRIKVYVNKFNIGQFQNRNKAAKYATGEYIKYLDSDDIIYKNSLKIMITSMIQYPECSIGVPFTKDITNNAYPFYFNSNTSLYDHYKGGNYLAHGPSASIMKLSDFNKIGGFRSDIGILADTYLNLKLASLNGTVFFQRDLIFWRIHDYQITVNQNKHIQMIIERYSINKIILNDPKCPLQNNQKKELLYIYKKINTKHFFKILFRLEIKDAILILNKTDLNFNSLILFLNPFRLVFKIINNFKYTAYHIPLILFYLLL